jgi:predicted nucleic acid-binding protein
MPLDRAMGYVRGWLDRPNVHVLVPGARHLDLALGLLADVGTAGNLTTDVQLAAHAIESRAEIHSNDTDFDRFDQVTRTNPLG